MTPEALGKKKQAIKERYDQYEVRRQEITKELNTIATEQIKLDGQYKLLTDLQDELTKEPKDAKDSKQPKVS